MGRRGESVRFGELVRRWSLRYPHDFKNALELSHTTFAEGGMPVQFRQAFATSPRETAQNKSARNVFDTTDKENALPGKR